MNVIDTKIIQAVIALKAIRELADGRRHYRDAGGDGCFDALGDVRDMADSALADLGVCLECNGQGDIPPRQLHDRMTCHACNGTGQKGGG